VTRGEHRALNDQDVGARFLDDFGAFLSAGGYCGDGALHAGGLLVAEVPHAGVRGAVSNDRPYRDHCRRE